MYRPQGGCRKGLSLCQLSQMQVQPGFSPRYAVSICGSETTLQNRDCVLGDRILILGVLLLGALI